MEIKTYGVQGLLDWVAGLKVGKATVSVHFTGGALTAYGITPATYTTKNEFLQHVIEQSAEFKSGKIFIVRSTVIEDENPKPRKAAAQTKPATSGSGRTSASASAQKEREEGSLRSGVETKEDEAAAADSGQSAEDGEVQEAESDDGIEEVATTCFQDAVAYLQENFGIASYKVRSYEAAQKAALEHGVRFTGGKFDETK